MRKETIIKTYAKFNELNKEQQTKAIESLRDINVDNAWHDLDQEDFHEILELLGFYDIVSNFSGFWSQGDGASFSASFKIPLDKKELKQRMSKVEDFAPNYFDAGASIKKLYLDLDFSQEIMEGESTLKIITHGHYSGVMYCGHLDLQEFARYMAAKYYIDLEKNYDYLVSDDSVIEAIEANDYEFDIDTLELS